MVNYIILPLGPLSYVLRSALTAAFRPPMQVIQMAHLSPRSQVEKVTMKAKSYHNIGISAISWVGILFE